MDLEEAETYFKDGNGAGAKTFLQNQIMGGGRGNTFLRSKIGGGKDFSWTEKKTVCPGDVPVNSGHALYWISK